MSKYKDNHSRLVVRIKLILILLALGLLSSIFLLTKTVEPSKAILTTKNNLNKVAEKRGVTNPIFAGLSDNDDQIKVRAKKVFPVKGISQYYLGHDFDADIELISGNLVHVVSDSAYIRMKKFTATLIENVVITTDIGYRLTTEKLDIRFDTIFAESPGPVAGTGPVGNITSNRMILTSDDATGDASLLFKGDVKVLYQPPIPED